MNNWNKRRNYFKNVKWISQHQKENMVSYTFGYHRLPKRHTVRNTQTKQWGWAPGALCAARMGAPSTPAPCWTQATHRKREVSHPQPSPSRGIFCGWSQAPEFHSTMVGQKKTCDGQKRRKRKQTHMSFWSRVWMDRNNNLIDAREFRHRTQPGCQDRRKVDNRLRRGGDSIRVDKKKRTTD